MKFCPQCGQGLIKKQIEEKDRLACPSSSCTYVFWDNPTPVVAAIVELHGSVILARNRLWPEKMFGLVTGFLEQGETPQVAVLREVKEELGLTGTVAEFIGLYSFLKL